MSKKPQVKESTNETAIWPGIAMMPCCDPEYTYARGFAITRHGVVAIYTQRGDIPHTRLTLVHNWREYDRTIAKVFTERGLLIVAGRFSREIVEASHER